MWICYCSVQASIFWMSFIFFFYYTVYAWIIIYTEIIYHVGLIEEYDVPIELLTTNMQLLVLKPKKRHHKTNKILSVGEENVTKKCRRCGKVGHDQLTCTTLTPLYEQNSTIANNLIWGEIFKFMHCLSITNLLLAYLVLMCTTNDTCRHCWVMNIKTCSSLVFTFY